MRLADCNGLFTIEEKRAPHNFWADRSQVNQAPR